MKFNHTYAFTAENGPSKEIISQRNISTVFKVLDLMLEIGSEKHFDNYVKDVKILMKEFSEYKEKSGF